MNIRYEAAVLVPVYRGEDNELRMVFIRRSEGGPHGGQIAFPGGKHNQQDRSMLDTALRETREEIGIVTDSIEVLDKLPVVQTLTTGFRITPYLARIIPSKHWCIEEREVVEVLEVLVRDFAMPETHGEAVEQFSNCTTPQHISFYWLGLHRVWGATYRILKPIVPRLLANEWTI
ncbi:CoA pyrophosphatase [Candidatus Parabeggiatoa sp. HSG14]|uniref:NUDIX hydrolase n=1 Tax=Candidatus Parabeggiatoa sp. HSG14 TaxID=3055593 RepID=UPI0025A6ABB1|nr:CoA pyrophosphatase [Thiotrichales bacterium HSG14]